VNLVAVPPANVLLQLDVPCIKVLPKAAAAMGLLRYGCISTH
jgi:hypothetical protein